MKSGPAQPGRERKRSAKRVVVIGLAASFLLLALVGARAIGQYQSAYAHVKALRELADSPTTLSSVGGLRALRSTVVALRSDLRELHMPLSSASWLMGRVPGLGPRLVAAETTRLVGEHVTEAAELTLAVGQDVASAPIDNGGWLDRIVANETSLERARNHLRQARLARHSLHLEDLEPALHSIVQDLDRMLGDPALNAIAELDIGALEEALGLRRSVRYLALMQNPAELRPAGGFPGSAALITIRRGQLADVSVFDVRELTEAYVRQRSRVLPAPWPLQHYLPQDGFLLHDALWWPDFMRGAGQVAAMYDETDWPPIDGVIGIHPSLIGALVDLVGPFEVDLSEGRRAITAANVYAEIERERDWFNPADGELEPHKLALRTIASELVGRLRAVGADRGRAVLDVLLLACDRKDLQVFSRNRRVQDAIEGRGCAGRQESEPAEPTLAVSFANLVTGKTSQRLATTFTVARSPLSTGQRIDLLVDVVHAGRREEDPVYDGFQRWLVDVALPAQSTILQAPEPIPNPEAASGGSYLFELYPGEATQLRIQFALPDSERLLVRKQAGLTPPRLVVATDACQAPEILLVADTVIHFSRGCAIDAVEPRSTSRNPTAWSLGLGGVLDVQPRHRPRGKIDSPVADQPATGRVNVFGWAADPTAPHRTGVEAVDVYLDGAYKGRARHGLERSDVATVFRSPELLYSGFSFELELEGVAHGQHTIQVVIRGALTGSSTTYTQTITVQPGADLRGNVDAPPPKSRIDGPLLRVRGWALDRAAAHGTGISQVRIYLDDALLGEARLNVDRPDVAATLGTTRPGLEASGYELEVETARLPRGVHTLRVVTRSTEGATLDHTREVEIADESDPIGESRRSRSADPR